MMCVPPGWCEHSKIMMVPSSVMPAVSPHFAPHASSSCLFHLDDLLDAPLAGLRPSRDNKRTNFFHAIMGPPKPDERAVTEGEISDVFGADAEAPQAITPHLGDPLPVFHAIQHADRSPPARP